MSASWVYRYVAEASWFEAPFNAAMILTGVRPANPMLDDGAKLFASACAIFGGAAYPAVPAIGLDPLPQRMLMLLHVKAQAHGDEG